MATALKPLGLTHVQFVLLASTWWLTEVAGESPTQRRVAEHAATDPMMTSQVLRVLEERSLITRSPDPKDGRARRLGVTHQGAALAQQAMTVVETADAAFFDQAGRTGPLLEVLRRLTQ